MTWLGRLMRQCLDNGAFPAQVQKMGQSSERSRSSHSRFYYFTRGVPTGCAFLLGTLGDVL